MIHTLSHFLVDLLKPVQKMMESNGCDLPSRNNTWLPLMLSISAGNTYTYHNRMPLTPCLCHICLKLSKRDSNVYESNNANADVVKDVGHFKLGIKEVTTKC